MFSPRILCGAVFCFFTVAALGQASQPDAGEALKATITAVQGAVQVRESSEKPWKKAEVGMVLDEQAEFRTGPRSAVQFTIPPDQTIALDRLGTVKLLTAIKEKGGKIKTELGMKYGRTRYDIEEAGLQHDAVLRSPSATLAVRGTKVSLFEQRPFKPEAVSLTGRADFKDERKQVPLGAKGGGKTKITTDQPNSAAVALAKSFVDPTISLARTDAEEAIVSSLLSNGSTVFFDRDAGIRVVTGGTPPSDAQLIPSLPGYLNFVVRWDTPSNIDFSIGSPGGPNNAGEFLYPARDLNTNSSGGKIPFDHRGGPHGGIEIAYWPADYPKGLYGLGLVLVSGQPTNARVDAFLGGKRIGIYDGLSLKPTVVVPVLPAIPGISEGTLAGIVPVGTSIPGVSGHIQRQAAPVKTAPAFSPAPVMRERPTLTGRGR